MATRLQLAAILFGSLAAALISHIAIDVLGDVLLSHDAYDDMAHTSRQTGAIAIGVALLVTLTVATRAAFLEARGEEAALRTLLRLALPRCLWRHWLAVTAMSLVLIAMMEACDAAGAGRPSGNIVALFGGSLLLAGAVAASVAAFITMVLRVTLLRLTGLHGVIVAIVVAFIRLAFPARSVSLHDWRDGRSSHVSIGMRGRTAAERAPPHFPSLVFS